MATELKRKTKIILLLITMSIVLLSIDILQPLITSNNLNFLNGVFMTAEFLCCLIILRIDLKKGYFISMVWVFASVVKLSRGIFLTHRFESLPGVTNTLFYGGILTWLYFLLLKLNQKSITDKTTSLMNKKGLIPFIQNRIEDKESFDIIFLKISNIRTLNETYGLQYGDLLKKNLSDKLKEICESIATIAVFDGANFVIVTKKNEENPSLYENILVKLKEKTVLSLANNEIEFFPEIFIGYLSYLSPKGKIKSFPDAETLIMQASTAETCARKEKKNVPVRFEDSMVESLKRSIEIDKLIRKALVENYFYLVYQPQYTLKGKFLRGFETLIRLKTPDGVFVSPGEFIPVAENSDLILKIDEYVLRRSMKEMKDVVKQKPATIISINVSAKNISNEKFPQKVFDIVRETGFPAENLEIEITEYCLAENLDITIENIVALRKAGIQVALDDFGTGYTSMNYLSKLPINLLKIDKSLIDDIENDEKRLSFVNSIVNIGHLMGCEVISEGVENEKQIELLKEKNCDFVQGFVWGRPEELEKAKSIAMLAD